MPSPFSDPPPLLPLRLLQCLLSIDGACIGKQQPAERLNSFVCGTVENTEQTFLSENTQLVRACVHKDRATCSPKEFAIATFKKPASKRPRGFRSSKGEIIRTVSACNRHRALGGSWAFASVTPSRKQNTSGIEKDTNKNYLINLTFISFPFRVTIKLKDTNCSSLLKSVFGFIFNLT